MTQEERSILRKASDLLSIMYASSTNLTSKQNAVLAMVVATMETLAEESEQDKESDVWEKRKVDREFSQAEKLLKDKTK